MKFRYEFNNGEIEAIEVAGEWYDALVALEAEEKRNERRETRRHTSFDGLDMEGEWFIDPMVDTFEESARKLDAEELHQALAALSPRQRELIIRIFFHGEHLSDIAAEEGVDKSAIAHRIERIQKNLKKALE